MRAKGRKKSKRKKIRFREVKFKLSEKQFRSLSNYSKARKTTVIKLIKKSIDKFMVGYDVHVPKHYYVSERQLDLFGDVPASQGDQLID